MRNSSKRFSKQRHAASGQDFHDLDSVALQLADINLTALENPVDIVPTNSDDNNSDDWDRLMVDTGFDCKLSAEPSRLTFSFADEVKFGNADRIQPVMDFPLKQEPADNPKLAANQPEINNSDDLTNVIQKDGSSADRLNGMVLNNPSDIEAPSPKTATSLDFESNSSQPTDFFEQSPLHAVHLKAGLAASRRSSSYLLALLLCLLLASTAFLGYMVFEMKMELAQLNRHLAQINK